MINNQLKRKFFIYFLPSFYHTYSEVGKKSLEQLGLFLEDFRQQSSRSLELDKEIIVQLNKFLKE